MERLPSNYQISSFDPNVHEIGVCFRHGVNIHKVNIKLPVVNGLYPEGIELDNYIMSFSPYLAKEVETQHLQEKAANASYISNLVKEHTKIPVSVIKIRNEAMAKRQTLLYQSDWTQLPDAQSSLDDEEKQRWLEYRKALRDITAQPGWPTKVIWPKMPSVLMVTIYE
jgi:hypothetical protein